MTERRAWSKFYWDDFLVGTIELSAHDTGVYIKLLARMYGRDGSIPDDPPSLARLVGSDTRQFKRCLNKLIELGKITRENGVLSNRRVLDELGKSREISQSASQNSRKRWDAEKGKTPNKNNGRPKNSHSARKSDSNAPDMLARASPEPDTPPIVPPSKRDASPPAFKGALFEVSKSLFDSWKDAYWSIPDLRAEIAALDTWATGRWTKANWKNLLAAKLNEKHQARVADGAKRPPTEEQREKRKAFEKRCDEVFAMPHGPERDAALAELRKQADADTARMQGYATG